MKFAWLEKHAQEGLIRPEALEQIYRDIDGLVKSGASTQETAAGLFSAVIGGALGVAAGKGVESLLDKADDKFFGRRALAKARETVSASFGEHADKARARFDDIASFAPHVAMNEQLARRIISTKLENGLSDSDTQALALIQAQHMPDVARGKSYMPKLAEIRPEAVGSMVADLFMVKEASLNGFGAKASKYLKSIAMHSAIPLLIGAGGGAINAALAKLDQRKIQTALENSFNKAMALSDKDREPLHENREKARQAFSSLVHFAPHVALEPQAARAFMSKIVAFDQGMNVDDVRALTEIQKNISAAGKPGAFSVGAEVASRFTKSDNMIQKGFEGATDHFIQELNQPQMNLGT